MNETLPYKMYPKLHNPTKTQDCVAVRDNRDGHLLFEVEMYLQKGCIMVSGVESS